MSKLDTLPVLSELERRLAQHSSRLSSPSVRRDCPKCGGALRSEMVTVNVRFEELGASGCGEVWTLGTPYCPHCDGDAGDRALIVL